MPKIPALNSLKRSHWAFAAVLAGASILALPATAAIRAEQGRMTAPPPGAPTAAGAVVLVNDGARARTLVGVESAAAARVSVHDMSMTGGVMRMRPSGPLVIPGHGQAALGPASGRHLMFVGLKSRLKVGDSVPVTFVFDQGPRLQTALRVEGPAPRP
jgi:copper(I)-binding protein